ncbi:hypothetical protein [Pelagovum pacificum]|uniref:Uncharacterized protein n=1 Tax=Pelagovum pacificum TaxID=2588711 RepID=A0A5C5GKD3_9RHOB|nr:hypothetical protein [Pelagovum pacificum]QQA42941.1 hypothetical protein I8N54_19570 [Pelagovum pacificum]TNY33916.1 hypothetical protein FHY64_11820 [Pelagovum pacificum]
MIWPVVLFLALQAFVFLVWAALAFQTLFRLRARAVDRTGRQFPGPVTFINTTSEWMRDPAEARQRRILLAATLLMISLTLISAYR